MFHLEESSQGWMLSVWFLWRAHKHSVIMAAFLGQALYLSNWSLSLGKGINAV